MSSTHNLKQVQGNPVGEMSMQEQNFLFFLTRTKLWGMCVIQHT